MRLRAFLLLTALAVSGCKQPAVEHPNLTTTAPSTTTAPINPTPAPEEAPAQPRPPVVLKILSPRDGETLSAKSPVTVSFSLSGYELQNDGQRLHVILDNNPYEACYDLSKPFTFKNPISPGTHTIRAFPAGGPMTAGLSQHESLKDPGAFAVTTFVVGKPDAKLDAKNTVKPGAPLLTFSQPRGEYIGEQAKRIMLDFWVQNAALGPNAYKVKYKLNNGKEVTLTEWKKTLLVGLPPGESQLEMWLVGPDGGEVPGAFNHVVRKITLKEFAEKSLFERLGGQAGIEAVVADLLALISQDQALAKRFAKADIARLREQLSTQLCEVTGGPCEYTGKGMKISSKEFEAMMRDLSQALEKNQIPEREQREVLEALGAMRPQIVER